MRCGDDSLWVKRDGGRVMAVSPAGLPRLPAAMSEQRKQFELSPCGIHREALDEDVSIDGPLAGHDDMTPGRPVVSD